MKVCRLGVSTFVLMLVLSGCGTWAVVGGRHYSSSDRYEVEYPPGWRRFVPDEEADLITRDGMALQSIRVARIPFDKDPPNTKRKLAKGMLPQEVADVVIGDFFSNRSITNFQVLENSPALVGGYPGFKLVYSYQTRRNLKKQGVYYGVLVDQWYYHLSFQAPARFYFGRDLPTFEKIRDTFKITL